jgi:hypothetical protein
MRFAILGPLRAEGADGAIELKAHKQRVALPSPSEPKGNVKGTVPFRLKG